MQGRRRGARPLPENLTGGAEKRPRRRIFAEPATKQRRSGMRREVRRHGRPPSGTSRGLCLSGFATPGFSATSWVAVRGQRASPEISGNGDAEFGSQLFDAALLGGGKARGDAAGAIRARASFWWQAGRAGLPAALWASTWRNCGFAGEARWRCLTRGGAVRTSAWRRASLRFRVRAARRSRCGFGMDCGAR